MPDREAASRGKTQNYANHKQNDPVYFYFFSVCILAATICAVVAMIRTPGWTAASLVLLNVGVMGVYMRARTYPLTVQDRVVKLETRLRLERLLPEDLRARIDELSLGQLIALRFASDEELADLVRQVLEENITSGDAIKKRVKHWRADWLRV